MEHQKPIAEDGKGKRSVVGSLLVGLFGAIGATYLLYPSLGVFELIPDAVPFLGSLDEAAATMLVISCLSYFGVDLGGLFGRKSKTDDIIDVEVVEK
jgi:hypothetical protein